RADGRERGAAAGGGARRAGAHDRAGRAGTAPVRASRGSGFSRELLPAASMEKLAAEAAPAGGDALKPILGDQSPSAFATDSSLVSSRLTSSTSATSRVPAACSSSSRLCRKLYLACA